MAFLHSSRRLFSSSDSCVSGEFLRTFSRSKLTGRQALALSQPMSRQRLSSRTSSAVWEKLSI